MGGLVAILAVLAILGIFGRRLSRTSFDEEKESELNPPLLILKNNQSN